MVERSEFWDVVKSIAPKILPELFRRFLDWWRNRESGSGLTLLKIPSPPSVPKIERKATTRRNLKTNQTRARLPQKVSPKQVRKIIYTKTETTERIEMIGEEVSEEQG